MVHMLSGSNIGLITARSNASSANDHFFVTRQITEAKCGESSRQCALFPLRLSPASSESNVEELNLVNAPDANFSGAFIMKLEQIFKGAKSSLTPEDIFHYAYAVFYSPGYRNRYVEFLKIDFPRLPLTGNLELFRSLAKFGDQLTALHLLESPKLKNHKGQFTGNQATEVNRAGWSENTVWINSRHNTPNKEDTGNISDKPGDTGFTDVPEAIWRFRIGGYQVCHKWLKDRKGRTLTNDDILHYRKIVTAISETIRLMAEIDEVIEAHGGWPGAFQTESDSKEADS